jgi:nitroreductase / dihydropteridine reductase
MSKEILASMAWRRAAKHFLPPLRPIDISPILNAALLAPTSFGIQPFQIYVVSSAEMKKKIQPAAYNQPQVTDD